MQERRRDFRWQINQQVKLKLEGAQAFVSCYAKDINFKGLQISLRMKLPPDTFLKLSIALSDEFILDLEAWVAWHKSISGLNVYGLYFNKIKDKEKIYKFVYKYFPQEVTKRWGQELKIKNEGEVMRDRRIFARFPVSFPLRFIDLSMNGDGEAEAQDISVKGIGLVIDKELKPRTTLEMWLKSSDKGEPVYTRGEVAWSKKLEPNKYRTGINLERADLMGLSRVFK